MKRLGNRRVVLVTLALLGIVLGSRPLVAQNPNAGTAPVTIVSPIPLPVTGTVHDADRGTPFTTTSPRTSPADEPPEVVFSTQVSAGHVGVIEHVSVRLANCAAGVMTVENFTLRAGTKQVFLEPVHVTAISSNAFLANETTKFVVAPGEAISVEAINFSSSGCPAGLTFIATISGEIIPSP
jgi:hypothetical protein